MGVHRKFYVFPHRNGWKYKRAVPRDLRPIVGKQAWRKWLGVITRPEAEIEGRALALDHDRLIRRLRKLTDDEREHITARDGLTHLPHLISNTEMAIELMNEIGADVPRAGMSERVQAKVAVAVLAIRAQQKAKRWGAEIAIDKHLVSKVGSANASGGITPLIKLWRQVSKPRGQDSVERMTLYGQRFLEHIGNPDPLTVTKAHVIAFRDALERRQDITWKTAQKHLDALHRRAPNYDAASVAAASLVAARTGGRPAIMIDASHGNSGKNADNQPLVVEDVARQIELGDRRIIGMMVEAICWPAAKTSCAVHPCSMAAALRIPASVGRYHVH